MTQNDLLKNLTPEQRQKVLERLRERQATAPRTYPMTPAQQRLYFLSELRPSRAYNMATALELQGNLEVSRLKTALQHLVQRHEALRTTFQQDGERFLQVVHADLEVPFQMLDFSQESPERTEQMLLQEARTLFDLRTGPLLRISLIHHSDVQHTLSLVVHHSVADGWSLGLLLQDLRALYAGQRLPAPSQTFGAYASLQQVQSAEDASLTQWKERLAGPLPLLNLPLDHPRPALQGDDGDAVVLQLDSELAGLLRSEARRQNLTPFMVLLTAYQVLLCKSSGQQEVTTGTPTLGRSRAEWQNTVGYFANTVVLRSDLPETLTVQQAFQKVKGTTLSALEHQQVPFERVLETLEVERDFSHSPLFQAMFAHQVTPLSAFSMGEMTVTPREVLNQTAKFDVQLLVFEEGNAFRCIFEYSTELFEHNSVQLLAQHYQHLLKEMLLNPTAKLGELDFLTQADRETLQQWNSTEVLLQGPLLLHQRIEQQAQKTPDAPAVVFEQKTLTYHQLNQQADLLAAHLQALGVGPDIPVAILMDRSGHLPVALLGVLKAGGAYVPLDPGYPQERLAYMLQDSKAGVLLIEKGTVPGWVPETLVVLQVADLPRPPLEEDLAVPLDPDSLAYIIYTSGSTGQPKGVMNTHRGVVNRLLWMQDIYSLTEKDRVLQKTPMSFDVSVWEFFWPLITGATLVLARPEGHRDPRYLSEVIEQQKITVLHFVPSMLRAFLQDFAPGRCPSLREVMCSGEALPLDVTQQFFARSKAGLHNLYGPTEAAIDVTFWPCQQDEKRASVPIGRPIANTRIHIADQNLRPLPIGIPGELLIEGTGLARGYLGKAALTAEKFVTLPSGERVYRTGDLARWNARGELEFLGRLDHQVKIRGFRIELGEIEVALKSLSGVQDAAVMPRTFAGAEQLVAYMVSAEPLQASKVRGQLSRTLPEHMVPQHVVFLEALPLSPNGKLDRKNLPLPDLTVQQQAYVAPSTAQEKDLADIWAQVLGVEKVGLDDGFFALGGDSIRSLTVISRAREKGLGLTLQQLFQHPTLRELAASLQDGVAETETTVPFSLVPSAALELLPEGLEDAYPLSTLQAGLVFQSELHAGSALYHDIMTYRIQGEFRKPIFIQALDRLVRRHPILRTSFDLGAPGGPLQRVHRHVQVPFELHDLRGLDAQVQENRLHEDLQQEKQWRFDWASPPLARFQVHLLDDQTYQYTLSFHDSLLDGWSVNAFQAELFSSYQQLLQGQDLPEKPTPQPLYRDFVQAELQALQSESKGFWQQELSGAQATVLPRWVASQTLQKRGVALSPVKVAEAEGARLHLLARELGVSIKHVLLAWHLKSLSVLTNQQDLVSGLEQGGRLESGQSEEVLGLFLNTLPFRLDLTEGSFLDLIRQVHQKERSLLPHRRYPMARMQQGQQGSLPFEVVFNYTHFHVAADLLKLQAGRLLQRSAVLETEYPLRAEFNQGLDSSALTLDLHYDTSQLGEKQVQQIGQVYREVLQALVQEPEGSHTRRSFVPPSEEHVLLRTWNSNQQDFPLDSSFKVLFEKQVEITPDHIAVSCQGRHLTYRELNDRANRLSHLLMQQGVGPEVLVPILMERSGDFLMAMLAVFKAGAAYVPLDPQHPELRLWQVLEQLDAPLILTQHSLLQVLDRVSRLGLPETVLQLALDALDLTDQPTSNPEVQTSPENLAYVIYTSGSTGKPKGAMVLQKGMVNHLYAKVHDLRLTPEDVVAQTASQCFDISVWQFLVALLQGGQTVVYPDAVALDPLGLLRCVVQDGVSVLETVPSLLRATTELLQLQAPPALQLRWLLVTGEALPPDLCTAWFQFYPHIPLLNAYGPTECSDDVAHFALHAPLPEHTRITPIGSVIPNMQLYVLNPQLKPVPLGTPGELFVGGVGVGRGYFKDQKRTAEVFLEDPFVPGGRLYRTGDLVRWNVQGQLEFLGRLDHQVKIRGFRIELGEIEAVLNQHPQVREAVVIGHQDRLGAYVVLTDVLDVQRLRQHVALHLPDYMVPSWVVVLPEMPLNANGKLDRKQLPEPQWSAAERPLVPPSGALETQLLELWCELLGQTQLSVEDSFFEVGGHSLLLVQLHARVQACLERELPMTLFFEHPTIRSFALHLQQEGSGKDQAEQALDRGQQRRQAMQRRQQRRGDT
ncbi:non-ribosomal peptide synthetase [Deinococcus roseus]|uniref:Carrier domain-containing protein n=1 Tax=Deinococcus roseus TaxID=392414 RepID=A0ABQ2DBN7_9DEIO|nr:non-ribosomal peptide synthetase [Deinococcus roseus]GGJ52791.1 hypothetical protein GCM10008938_43460 [Deinococcus roseus]